MEQQKNRIFGITPNIEIIDLIKYMNSERLDYIKLIILFGSRVAGENHSRSDYDFAVIPGDIDEPWGVMAKVWNDIEDVTGLSECDLDIVDLRTADKVILDSIKSNYLILKGEESEFQRLFNKDK